VPTILLHSLLNRIGSYHILSAAPPNSVAAQYEANLPLAIGGLILLLLIMLLLFWRMSRKSRRTAAAPPKTRGEPTTPIVAAPPQPAPLVLEFSAEAGQHIRFTLDRPALTIGRASDNDIVLTAPILNVDTVSQHHARLRRDQDGYVVRDLNSKNGLAVNGRYTIENLLEDGDRLQFGDAEAIFRQSTGGAV
jgi:hypothetical protein